MNVVDIVIAAGQALFILSLFPSLLSDQKPHTRTSILTAGVLWVYTATFLWAGLWLSTATICILGLQWTILWWQRRSQS